MRHPRKTLRFLFLNSWKEEVAEGTGTAVSISTRARGLRELGHEVDGFGPEPGGGPFLARRLLFNLRIRSELGRGARFGRRGVNTVAAPGTARLPPVVVGFDLDGFLVSGARRRSGAPPRPPGRIPFVQELKGIAADEARFASGPDRPRLLLLAALERWSARRADLVVVPSRYSAELAQRLYGVAPSCVAVVPEGIDLAPWEALRGKRRERPEAEPTILSVARQYPRKSTVALLRAHRLLLDRLPGARLRIVGGGPELPRLRSAATELGTRDRTTFLDSVSSDEEVRAEYLGADCFCLPSLQEGFGIVFLEAMAAGLPIVGPDRGAPTEVFGGAGIAVDPEDPDALAVSLGRVLTNPSLRGRLRAEGVERVRRFEFRTVARAFERVLRDRIPELGTTRRRSMCASA